MRNAAGILQLVSYFGATYEQMDPVTGSLTPLGTLGGGYESSGDITTIDGGTYLSAVGHECNDCLFQINPLTGAAVRSFGDLGNLATSLVFDAGTPSFYGAASSPPQ